MSVIHVNFLLGTVQKPSDGKTCLNCGHGHDGLAPKAICLACTRFGHTDGVQDNWLPQAVDIAVNTADSSTKPVPKSAPAPAPNLAARKAAQRKDMLAKIHIAKGQCLKSLPGYTEDVYRATLEDMFDVQSAADLNPEQMHGLLLHFAGLGWQKKARKGAGKAPKAYASDESGQSREALLQKIEAMLTEKGRTEGTAVPWAYAVGILKKQSGGITKSLDQATREQLADIIAALWRDAKRKGRRIR